MREYVIYKDRPPYPSRVQVKYNAYPTFGKPWEELREFLPATIVNYALVAAPNKPAAIAEARRLFGGK